MASLRILCFLVLLSVTVITCGVGAKSTSSPSTPQLSSPALTTCTTASTTSTTSKGTTAVTTSTTTTIITSSTLTATTTTASTTTATTTTTTTTTPTTTPSALGENCTSNCSDQNAICDGTCKCKQGYYKSTNMSQVRCVLVIKLEVKHLNSSSVTNSSITVQWTMPSVSDGVTFTVTVDDNVQRTTPNNTYMIQNLTAGHLYLICVRTKLADVEQEVETNASCIHVRTDPPSVQTIHISDRKLTFIIGAGDFSRIDIIINNSSGTVWNTSITNETTLETRRLTQELGNLQPDKNFTVFIVTHSGSRCTGPQTVSFFTVPGQTVILNTTNINSSFVVVKWRKRVPPSNFTLGYQIKLMKENNCIQAINLTVNLNPRFPSTMDCSNSTDKTISIPKGEQYQYTITQLLPYTNYTVQITTVNSEGAGKENSYTFRTLTDYSGPVSALWRNHTTSNSTEVYWRQPQEPNGIIFGYRITVFKGINEAQMICIGLAVQNITSEQSRCSLNVSMVDGKNGTGYRYTIALDPYTHYTVTIVAVNSKGDGQRSSVSFATKIGVPQSPIEFKFSKLTPSSVTLTWEQKKPLAGPTEFEIVVWEQANRFSGSFSRLKCNSTGINTTSVVIRNLTSYWQYRFILTAYTSAGSSPSVNLSITTNESESAEVAMLNTTNLTSVSVVLLWKKPLFPNGNITAYHIIVKKENETIHAINLTVNRDVVSPTTGACKNVCSTTISPTNRHTDEYNYTVRNLLPHTNYTAWVAAVNSKGFGKETNTSFQTLIGVPPMPEDFNITHVTSSNVTLTWSPGTPPGGPTQFDIQIWEDKDRFSGDFILLKDVTGLYTNSNTIEQLISYWQYEFTLTAHTSAGRSGSVNTTVNTTESAPGKVENVSVLHVSGDYCHATVSFLCPSEKNQHGNITHYNVTYTSKNDQNRAPVLLMTQPFCNYSTEVSVIPEELYIFVVQAFIGDEYQGLKTNVSFNAPTGPSGPVSDFTAKALTSDSIDVHWKEPQTPNGNIHRYRITVLVGEVENQTICIGEEDKRKPSKCIQADMEQRRGRGKQSYWYNITSLQPYTNYTISIVAINVNGSGQSETRFERTKAGEPLRVNLGINKVSTKSISLSWVKPDNFNGRPVGYIIMTFESQGACVSAVHILYESEDNSSFTNISSPGCTVPTMEMWAMNRTLQYNVTNLWPYTNYSISVAAVNNARVGACTFVLNRTDIAVPTTPTRLTIAAQKWSSVTLTWTPQDHKPGPTRYTVHVYPALHRPGKNFVDSRAETVDGFSSDSLKIVKLLSSWVYNFTITASTDKGSSPESTSIQLRTEESAPGKVQDMTVTNIDHNYTAVTVAWECPEEKERNGFIKNYTVTYYHNPEDQENRIYGNYPNEDDCSHHSLVLAVIPEQNYIFKIRANAEFEGNETLIEFYTRPGKPAIKKPGMIFVETTTQTSTAITTTSFQVFINTKALTDSTNGLVTVAGLFVMLVDANPTLPTNSSEFKEWDTWRNWNKNHKGSYRATPPDWPPSSRKRRSAKSESEGKISFTVGSDPNCESSSCTNGPVPAGTKYKVAAVACTKAGCTAVSETTFATQPTSAVAGIAGGIAAALVVIVAVIVVVFFIRRRQRRRKEEEPDPELDNIEKEDEHSVDRPLPRKLSEFADVVKRLRADSGLLLTQEWQELNAATVKHDTKVSVEPENRQKNRYVNILSYDHTRVKLETIDHEEETDYINANYIPGYNSKREYIATQGPMVATLCDFWKMVWEQNVSVIVMLSGLEEFGVKKFDQYWPDEMNEPRQYGDIVVELVNNSVLSKHVIMIFTLSQGNSTRTLKHFYLPGWYDHNANLEVGDVIDFARYVRRELRPTNIGPILVHCSAGVGRTGTYICMDNFIQAVDNLDMDGTVDIFTFILKIRDCRPQMVQAERQYGYIYDAVLEMVTRKDKVLKGEENIYENTRVECMSVDREEEQIYENQGFVLQEEEEEEEEEGDDDER